VWGTDGDLSSRRRRGAVAKEASPLHLREGARAEEGLSGEQGRCQQDDHVGRLKMTRCGSHMSYG
jgi:hypothetical protein